MSYDFPLGPALLTALPSGALHWRAEALLTVSDLHFGKSERLARRGGSLLPPYETRETLLRLEADLMLENENSLTLVMLASFAEGMKKWRQQAQNQAQTLGWCRVLLRQTQVAKDLRFWVIFPVEGQAVELRF